MRNSLNFTTLFLLLCYPLLVRASTVLVNVLHFGAIGNGVADDSSVKISIRFFICWYYFLSYILIYCFNAGFCKSMAKNMHVLFISVDESSFRQDFLDSAAPLRRPLSVRLRHSRGSLFINFEIA